MGKEITSLEQIITESVVVGLGTTILLSIPCSIFSQMEYKEQLMQLTSPLFFLSSAWIYSLFRTYGLVETLADEEDKDPIDIAIENLRDSRKLRTSVNYYLSIGDHHQVKNIMDHVIEDCPERKVKYLTFLMRRVNSLVRGNDYYVAGKLVDYIEKKSDDDFFSKDLELIKYKINKIAEFPFSTIGDYFLYLGKKWTKPILILGLACLLSVSGIDCYKKSYRQFKKEAAESDRLYAELSSGDYLGVTTEFEDVFPEVLTSEASAMTPEAEFSSITSEIHETSPYDGGTLEIDN